MFPGVALGPVDDDGWILTGKATKADESSPPAPAPPPPPPPPMLPIPPLMRALNGNSPVRLENSGGGRELRRFGVAMERTGVVRDSVCVVVCGAVIVEAFPAACMWVWRPPSLSRFVVVVAVVSLAPVAVVVSSMCGRGEMACCRRNGRDRGQSGRRQL